MLPAGGGKSLCYSLMPALLLQPDATLLLQPGVTCVVALMTDRVAAARGAGVAAAALHEAAPERARAEVYAQLERQPRPVLRRSLRRLRASPRKARLHSRGLQSLIAVDEAHCISEHGRALCPEYWRLERHAEEAAPQRDRGFLIMSAALRHCGPHQQCSQLTPARRLPLLHGVTDATAIVSRRLVIVRRSLTAAKLDDAYNLRLPHRITAPSSTCGHTHVLGFFQTSSDLRPVLPV